MVEQPCGLSKLFSGERRLSGAGSAKPRKTPSHLLRPPATSCSLPNRATFVRRSGNIARVPSCVPPVARFRVVVMHSASVVCGTPEVNSALSRPSRNQTGSLQATRARQPRALAHCHHLADRQSSVIVGLTKCASKICVMASRTATARQPRPLAHCPRFADPALHSSLIHFTNRRAPRRFRVIETGCQGARRETQTPAARVLW